MHITYIKYTFPLYIQKLYLTLYEYKTRQCNTGLITWGSYFNRVNVTMVTWSAKWRTFCNAEFKFMLFLGTGGFFTVKVGGELFQNMINLLEALFFNWLNSDMITKLFFPYFFMKNLIKPKDVSVVIFNLNK